MTVPLRRKQNAAQAAALPPLRPSAIRPHRTAAEILTCLACLVPGPLSRQLLQGVPGAYSEMAALKACPGWEPLPCEQFEVAFQALSQVWARSQGESVVGDGKAATGGAGATVQCLGYL